MDIESIKPTQDFVLVRRDKELKTYGGGVIYIPDNYKDWEKTGTIIAVGPGTKKSPMGVKVGEKIAWDAYYQAGVLIDEDHVLVRCSDILATINEG